MNQEQEWEEVVRLRFEGDRFSGCALDPSALMEIVQYIRVVVETAKALWRAENPDRRRLPRGFEEGLRLCLRRIEDGSAVPVLETPTERSQQSQPNLFGGQPHHYIVKSVDTSYLMLRAFAEETTLPADLPETLLAEYTKLGSTLKPGETIGVAPVGDGIPPVPVTLRTRSVSLSLMSTESQQAVELTGIVQEVDARQKRFQLWPDEKTVVTVDYPPEHEEEVIRALDDRHKRRLRLIGTGEYNSQGTLLRVGTVDSLVPIEVEKPRPRFGSGRGVITMGDDFDAPLSDFADYME